MLIGAIAKTSNRIIQSHFNTLMLRGGTLKVTSLKNKVRALEEEVSTKASIIINLRNEVSEYVEVIGKHGLEAAELFQRMTINN